MSLVIDPWVVNYERLMELFKTANVPEDLTPRSQKKALVLHQALLTNQEYNEALSLLKILYKEEL
jgi:hypothetical protein